MTQGIISDNTNMLSGCWSNESYEIPTCSFAVHRYSGVVTARVEADAQMLLQNSAISFCRSRSTSSALLLLEADSAKLNANLIVFSWIC